MGHFTANIISSWEICRCFRPNMDLYRFMSFISRLPYKSIQSTACSIKSYPYLKLVCNLIHLGTPRISCHSTHFLSVQPPIALCLGQSCWLNPIFADLAAPVLKGQTPMIPLKDSAGLRPVPQGAQCCGWGRATVDGMAWRLEKPMGFSQTNGSNGVSTQSTKLFHLIDIRCFIWSI